MENNKNKNNDKLITLMGEEYRESDIQNLLKDAMRELGHKSFIDTDGVEKSL